MPSGFDQNIMPCYDNKVYRNKDFQYGKIRGYQAGVIDL